jgi:hypothetical protein
VRGDAALDGLAEVVPKVPTISDVDRAWRADSPGLGESASAVTAYRLCSRMSLKPRGDRCDLPVRQQVDGPVRGDVDQDTAIDPATSQREFVDAQQHRRSRTHGLRNRADQSQ